MDCVYCGGPIGDGDDSVVVKQPFEGNAIRHQRELAMKELRRNRGLPPLPPQEARAHVKCPES